MNPSGTHDHAPLVYACSGCSSAAQLANHVALQLDRRGVAEMSCIAGVGGDVPKLVRLATSGRPIVALDGCPLCVGAAPRGGAGRHYQLHQYGGRSAAPDFDLPRRLSAGAARSRPQKPEPACC